VLDFLQIACNKDIKIVDLIIGSTTKNWICDNNFHMMILKNCDNYLYNMTL